MKKNMIEEFRAALRGAVRVGEPLSRRTSFRIGGPAAIWAEPKDASDLRKIVVLARARRVPVFIIGGGSNILVSDEGFKGVAIHLGAPYFKDVKIRGTLVKAGAGVNVSALVRLCCNRSLAGLESLIGIPGTVGGAVFMNAGGWANPIFRNIGEFIISVKVMDRSGNIRVLRKDDLKFGYRSSGLGRYVITEATLRLSKGDRTELNSRCAKFLKMKSEKQALDVPSAGCVFKNPPDFQFTSGQLIDMLGLKGARRGGAEISAKHANFIVNRKGAMCKDVLELIGLIRKKVTENYKIPLELEIKVIGL